MGSLRCLLVRTGHASKSRSISGADDREPKTQTNERKLHRRFEYTMLWKRKKKGLSLLLANELRRSTVEFVTRSERTPPFIMSPGLAASYGVTCCRRFCKVMAYRSCAAGKVSFFMSLSRCQQPMSRMVPSFPGLASGKEHALFFVPILQGSSL